MLRDPTELCLRGYRELGSCFAVAAGPMRFAVLVGPANHATFFRATDSELSVREAARPFRAIFGDAGFPEGSAEHREFLRVLRPLFAKRGLERFGEIVDEVWTRELERLGRRGSFDLPSFMWRVNLISSVRYLWGDRVYAAVHSELDTHYRSVLDGVSLFLPSGPWLPGYRRSRRSMRLLTRAIGEMLRAPTTGDDGEPGDAVAHFRTLGDDRPSWTVDETASLLVLLVTAAHQTTASFASWCLILLLQSPRWIERILDELGAIDDGPAFIAAAAASPTLELVLKEVERLRPPQPMIARYVREELEVGEHSIPRGWLAMLCPRVSHRVPEVFSDPLCFDPDRFTPARGEGRAPYSLIGFGGGARACTGRGMAHLATRILVGRTLQRFRMQLLDEPRVNATAMIHSPASPCLVEYSQRGLPAQSVAMSSASRRMV